MNFPAAAPPHYPARVMSRLGHRAVELVVGGFALLGFVYVPLGDRTGLEHVARILRTPAATELGRSLLGTAERARARLLGEVTPGALGPGGPEPLAPLAPASARGHSPRRSERAGTFPRPEPPALTQLRTLDAGADASLGWSATP